MTIDEAYKLIGVNESCSDTEIKKAYRKLMIKYHPDNCDGDERIAKQLGEAYEIINKNIQGRAKRIQFTELCERIRNNDTDYIQALNSENTFVEFNIRVDTPFGKFKSTTSRRYNKAYYSIEFEIPVDSIDNSVIEVEICGRKVELNMCSKSTVLELKIQGIRVVLNILRKLKTD